MRRENVQGPFPSCGFLSSEAAGREAVIYITDVQRETVAWESISSCK